jgi:hypothetical protein
MLTQRSPPAIFHRQKSSTEYIIYADGVQIMTVIYLFLKIYGTRNKNVKKTGITAAWCPPASYTNLWSKYRQTWHRSKIKAIPHNDFVWIAPSGGHCAAAP